jgi:hypothetical protein
MGRTTTDTRFLAAVPPDACSKEVPLPHRLLLPVLAAVVLLSAVTTSGGPTGLRSTHPKVSMPRAALAATRSHVRFGSPHIVDPIHTYGEPDIVIARSGLTYVSGPWGTGTQRSIWNGSVDGGRTFLPLHDRAVASSADSDTEIRGPGGGDTELSVDRASKVYYADLAALTTLKVATWRNRPPHMEISTVDAPHPSPQGYDRQWFAMWDPPNPAATRRATGYRGPFPVNYLVYTEVTGSGAHRSAGPATTCASPPTASTTARRRCPCSIRTTAPPPWTNGPAPCSRRPA